MMSLCGLCLALFAFGDIFQRVQRRNAFRMARVTTRLTLTVTRSALSRS